MNEHVWGRTIENLGEDLDKIKEQKTIYMHSTVDMVLGGSPSDVNHRLAAMNNIFLLQSVADLTASVIALQRQVNELKGKA